VPERAMDVALPCKSKYRGLYTITPGFLLVAWSIDVELGGGDRGISRRSLSSHYLAAVLPQVAADNAETFA
jgi:hypothetical protein